MEQADWFESWFGSPYYKILYQNRDEFEAQEFIENLLAHLEPMPGSRMVDIACGEGRYAIQLAEHGFDVTGIDLSYASIEKAKESEGENLHFMVHDMRLPFYINYFDYAFNFFTSFGYFEHDRDHHLAARSFAGGLKQDGILVIDYLNKDYVLKSLVAEEEVQRGEHTFRIKRKEERNHIIKQISFTGSDGAEKQFTESVAAFTLSDFVQMFKTAGLSLTGTFGNYKLGEYHPIDSPRMIMIFKKH